MSAIPHHLRLVVSDGLVLENFVQRKKNKNEVSLENAARFANNIASSSEHSKELAHRLYRSCDNDEVLTRCLVRELAGEVDYISTMAQNLCASLKI